MPDSYYKQKGCEFSAKGIYANFLETSKAVFIPKYNIPEDTEALELFRQHTGKPIEQIDCEEICKHGGSLHCLTKELWV
jgi:agmatine/peptidylarginine deiminase